MGRLIRTVLLVILIAVVAGLAAQNSENVSLKFFAWQSEPLPVWVLLVVALGLGILVGGTTFLADYLRLQRAVRRERRRADDEARRAEDVIRQSDRPQPAGQELLGESEEIVDPFGEESGHSTVARPSDRSVRDPRD